MKSKTRTILPIIVVLVVLGFITPHFAHAGWMDRALADVLTFGIRMVGYVFNFIFSLLFTFANWLVSIALKFNYLVADQAKNELVRVGWGISLSIANLGFVLVAIIAGFATIIGAQEYGSPKLIAKLVAAAILVNFSLTIAGTLIDFSNVLTNFFVNKIDASATLENPGTGISAQLANAFNIQKFLLGDTEDPLPPSPADESSLGQLGAAVLGSIAQIFFIMIFTAAGAIILLVFAAMLMRRFIILSMLLVLAPLAWLMWVFPGASGQSGKWWSKFWETLFFGPVMMFFLYLTLASVQGLGKLSDQNVGDFYRASPLQGIMMLGAQMITLIGLLVAGMILGEKLAGDASVGGMKYLNGAAAGAKSFASNTAQRFGQRTASSAAGQKIQQGFGGAARVARGLKLTGIAGALERGQESVQRTATAPKVQKQGLMASLAVGSGLMKAPKAGAFTKGELQTNYDELRARKERLEKSGASPQDLKAIDDNIDAVEKDLNKKNGMDLKGPALKTAIDNLIAERDAKKAKNESTAYHDKAILKGRQSIVEQMGQDTIDEKDAKTTAIEDQMNKTISELQTKLVATTDAKMRAAIEKQMKKEAEFYSAQFQKVEDSIEANSEDEYDQKLARIQNHHTNTIKLLGVDGAGNARADVRTRDQVISRVERQKGLFMRDSARNAIPNAVQSQLKSTQSAIDQAVASGTAPATSMQDKVTKGKDFVTEIRKLLNQNPGSKNAWAQRKTNLEDLKNRLNAEGFINPETERALNDAISQADINAT